MENDEQIRHAGAFLKFEAADSSSADHARAVELVQSDDSNTAIAHFHPRLKLDTPRSWVKMVTKAQALQAFRADAQRAKRSRLSRSTEVDEEEVAGENGDKE